MKLQVLVDNNTYIDQYYLGEPAVSYYIEIDGIRILFDTGYSDCVIKNARAMGINLEALTHIVLSHGHNDHTRGLKYLKEEFAFGQLKLIAHPHCFCPKWYGEEDIGAPFQEEQVYKTFSYYPSEMPLFLSENCCFLGQIPENFAFEKRKGIGKTRIGDREERDLVLDDSALVCRTGEGIFIITGCSHSGICNITEYARQIFGEDRIAGIIGGFHLFDQEERIQRTIQYLNRTGIKRLYPCHCVSLKAKAEMMKLLPVEEVGVGLTICI